MNNKFLIILTVLSLSLAAFLAGYLISQNDFTKRPVSPAGRSANIGGDFLDKFDSSQPESDSSLSGKIFVLSQRAVLSPTLSKEKNSVLYYDKSNGQVFQANPENLSEVVVSSKLLPNLVQTIWSPNKKEVVSIFYDKNGKRFKYYNYQTQKTVDLGTAVKSLAFSPDGSHIAYFKSLGADGAIYTSAPDGSSPRKIIDTRLSGLDIYWPLEEYISFKASVDGRDSVYLLLMTGNLTKILDMDDQADILWSPDGTRLLYSSRESDRVVLRVKEIASSKDTDLNTSSSANKCAWGVSGNYIICSVPRSDNTGEDIYKIPLSGNKELIASPQKAVNTSQIILTGIEDYIMLVNSTDGKIYALKF